MKLCTETKEVWCKSYASIMNLLLLLLALSKHSMLCNIAHAGMTILLQSKMPVVTV